LTPCSPGFIFRQTTAPAPVGIWAHYDIGEELGKGSFATVLKALHRADGKWYAVKMMQIDRKRLQKGDEADEHGNVKKPFKREIEIMETLRHRNICRMREVFIAPDTLSECRVGLQAPWGYWC
jgi:serine/threonine/tyrosine protein kinase RAD53